MLNLLIKIFSIPKIICKIEDIYFDEKNIMMIHDWVFVVFFNYDKENNSYEMKKELWNGLEFVEYNKN
jgi:hypothetical protein